jgi:DHA1 family tetracycline resistance protein-like MFS transporter
LSADHGTDGSSETAPEGGLSRGSLPTLLGIVFVDMLGFAMIIPLIPFYAERFGASASVVGLLVASYAMAQLVGAPILGGLSDRVGRKPILMASLVGTSLGFLLFGLAGSLWLLFVARSLDGLTGGNVSVAQAYIADVSSPEKRARNFGFIGAAFGIGFIVGPAMGGFLSRFGLSTPAFVAAGLAALNAVAVLLILPESLPVSSLRSGSSPQAPAATLDEGASTGPGQPGGDAVLAGGAEGSADHTRGWGHLRAGNRAGGLLWTRFWYMLAFVTYALIFALWAQYHLGVDAETAGYLLAYVGVLILIVQGGLVGWVSKRFPEGPVLLTCIALLAVSLAAWSQVDTIPALLAVQVPLSVAAGLFGATMNSALSQAVPAQEVGAVLGIGTSLESITRALSPTLGGILLDKAGPWAPGAFGATVLVLLLPFAVRALKRTPPAPAPPARS